ncbi:MAG: flagellar biosynthetic protein FliR [Rubrivivax sp.]
MVTLTEDQMLAWITPLLWPFLRTLALFSALPVLGTRTVPMRVRIGLSVGFAVRVVFAAIEFAGEFVGLQMGLNFAGFFDPMTASAGTASGRFYGTMVAFLFVVINGHLLVLAALLQSFNSFPVGPEPFAFLRATAPQHWGAEIFTTGLWIALPMIAMLLFVNLLLGMVSRVASQINIFAIGFPVTLSVGLIGMLISLPLLQAPFTMALERLLDQFR